MIDFGQRRAITLPRAQTALDSGCSLASHAQFRIFTRPLDRHFSQSHAAGDENWKWNAIISFFFLHP
jgi:hypothetical protein